MQPVGHIRRPYAESANGQSGAAPAAAVLTTVAVRTAAIIRAMGLAYIVVQIAIWHAYYAADPARLMAPVAATVWGAGLVGWVARHPLTAPLAVADSGVHIALALAGAWSVPAVMRGDVANWLFILLAGQTVVPMWFAPVALGAPLVLGSSVAYWAGANLAAPEAAARSAPAASAILLAAVGMVAWSGYGILRRRAAVADAALADADADEHRQYVALTVNRERREHERLLHDTVLNTLTALAREDASKGDVRAVVGRCRHDVELMQYVLGGQHPATQPPAGAVGGLVAAVQAVAAEMRIRGLDVQVDVDVPAATGTALQVPVPAVVAMARAVREALENVARHAGTPKARLAVRASAQEAGGADHGRLVVTIHDCGTGFDPADVGPDRLGVRRSIVERIADHGGSAHVQSAPGAGTTITLRWPGEPPGEGQPATARAQRGGAEGG